MAWLRSSLLVALLAVGCADTGGQTLIVLNNTTPDSDCVIDPDAGSGFIPAGRVDVQGVVDFNAQVGYLVTPAIQNAADSQQGALTSQRTVLLQGARVDLVVGTHADGTDVLSAGDLEALTNINALKFTAPFTGAIEPDGGLAGVGFELVPAPVLAAIGAALVEDESVLISATFTVFGRTVGGSGVESDPFTYPVTVCDGCLFTYVGSCLGLTEGTYPPGGACNVFQDAPGSCCLSSTDPAFLVCPAVPEVVGQ